MQILIQEEKNANKIYLHEETTENKWITDIKGNKIALIEYKDNNWYILSNKNVKITNLNNNACQEEFKLQNYETYLIQYKNANKKIVIYCMPLYEKNLIHLAINKENSIVTIGKDTICGICYNNKLVSKIHASLILNKGKWVIENHDKNTGTILNSNKIIVKRSTLENGDIIFILGLKIIIIGDNIFINNPDHKIKCDNGVLHLVKDDLDNAETNSNYVKMQSMPQYYYRMPRIINKNEKIKFKIANPPAKNDGNKMPFALTLGSTLSMGLISMITCFTTIVSIASGNSTFAENISQLLISFVMLISMMLIPILTMKWERKTTKKYESDRQKKYREYIKSKKEELIKLKKEKKDYLKNNYPTVDECLQIILNQTDRLWERKIKDYDFLSINLGIGNDTFVAETDEKESFTMEQDDLQELQEELKQETKTIENVPITISLKDEKIVGLIENNNKNIEIFLQEMLVQLMTFHSYDDLKLVFMLKKDRIQDWKYIKMLPYVWDQYNSFRFLGTDYADNMEDISNYLEKEFNERKNEKQEQIHKPYYLIITDNYRNIENLNITSKIIKEKENFGFGIFCIGNTIRELPQECKTFIKIDENDGEIIKSEAPESEQKSFTVNNHYQIPFDEIVQIVSNIQIKKKVEVENAFPEEYTFLDMFNVNNIEELDIRNRWKNNDAIISIAAPIGINELGKLIKLDIHEKAHGPHGLIAGSTGSREI